MQQVRTKASPVCEPPERFKAPESNPEIVLSEAALSRAPASRLEISPEKASRGELQAKFDAKLSEIGLKPGISTEEAHELLNEAGCRARTEKQLERQVARSLEKLPENIERALQKLKGELREGKLPAIDTEIRFNIDDFSYRERKPVRFLLGIFHYIGSILCGQRGSFSDPIVESIESPALDGFRQAVEKLGLKLSFEEGLTECRLNLDLSGFMKEPA